MNIEEFRNHCLSLKGVTEKMPFEKANNDYDRNLLVFSIGDKWFCFVNIEMFDFCNLKSALFVGAAALQTEYDAACRVLEAYVFFTSGVKYLQKSSNIQKISIKFVSVIGVGICL